MSNQTFNVHFVLKVQKKNKRELAPLFARIRLNGVKLEISTNRAVSLENWSTTTESVVPVNKANKEINQYLETFRSKIYNAYTLLMSTGEPMSVALLKEAIFGRQVVRKRCLIETANEHNEQFEQLIGKKYSYGSYKNYKTTLKYLVEFIPLIYAKTDLSLQDVDYKFCEHYYSFLTCRKNCGNNGANKQLQRVKTILNYAIKLGYISANPMLSYTLTFKSPNIVALTIEEINTLIQLPLKRDTLQKVRDAFIFQCYTGLPYGDLKRLKLEHIKKEENEYWVKMERQKTGVLFSVPLLKVAVELLKKYTVITDRSEYLFPILSNQKMNDNLKVIQEIAGLTKNLTTHLARHSFATTITLNNDVPIETVSRMLGHTNLRTTQRYAKVLDGKIDSDMKKLKAKLD